MYVVELGSDLMATITGTYGVERSSTGAPDTYDFISGPLATAIERFKEYEALPEVLGPAVRVVTVADPFFGAVRFTGVLVGPDVVEIAGFEADPDYWGMIDDDPEY